jgi:hypothetical protein
MFMRVLQIVSAVYLATWILPKFLLTRVEPWEIGVRQSLLGGISEEDFGLGYHLSVIGLHKFHHLPRTIRYLDYNDGPSAEAPALEVRTKENNVLFVDVTVPWRIKDGSAWRIIREGFADSYADKVRSTATGVLLEGIAAMSNTDVQQADQRQKTAADILPKLNAALEQYHVVAEQVVIRSIRFRDEYEQKLQNKQYFVVQGKLDEAKRQESVGVQETDTFEQGIQKDINLKREEWNAKIEALKTQYEVQIAEIQSRALQYDRKRRAEADAFYTASEAEGDLAEAKAEALGTRLKTSALATPAGRVYAAIKAAEAFKLGEVELNSLDPTFLQKFGSMRVWRLFFLGVE